MSARSTICYACATTFDGDAPISCCPRCLAPRRRGSIPDPPPAEAWLLGLYGHLWSLDQHGYFPHVIIEHCRDGDHIRACIDAVRAVAVDELVSRIRRESPPPDQYASVGFEAAVFQLHADHVSGTLEWWLGEVERCCLASLDRERAHYQQGLTITGA